MINNPELIKKAIEQIECLQSTLSDIKRENPHLYQEEVIQDHWEFWTTNEILEQIKEEFKDILLRLLNDWNGK